jgi:hypothetical protein
VIHSSSVEAYRLYFSAHSRLPKHIQDIDIPTAEMSYSNLSLLVAEIWKGYAEQTLENCATDPSFETYTAREKMLAYCYTLLEVMRADRDMIQLQWQQLPNLLRDKAYKGFFEEFQSFTSVLLEEGIQRGEIQSRPILSRSYPGLFQLAIVGVIGFWLRDESEQTEQTDVAIEKIVHLVFDTIAPGAVDSAFDLAQFLIKQRFNG